jgi:hypothetical protein
VPAVALLVLAGDRLPGVALIITWLTLTGLSVLMLEAVALIASPGPRQGRRLVHWGHWAFLLPGVAAAQIYPILLFRGRGSLAALGGMVILILALNRLGRALRLSRYFRLLIAATFYPITFGVATLYLPGFRFMNDPGYGPVALLCTLALLFAGPLLCAGAALGTAIRPRRRRII